jgi:uncharacterized protein with PIN domain
MMIDTFAVLAILRGEAERRSFVETIEAADSTGSFSFSRFGKGRHRAGLSAPTEISSPATRI